MWHPPSMCSACGKEAITHGARRCSSCGAWDSAGPFDPAKAQTVTPKERRELHLAETESKFDPTCFSMLANGGMLKMHSYCAKNQSVKAIAAPGFFDNAGSHVNTDDLLAVSAKDGGYLFVLSKDDSGTVTVSNLDTFKAR